MTTTVLRTWRPWHQRLFDFACTLGERLARLSVCHSPLAELDVRTLRDIGIDASDLSSIRTEAQGLAEVTRLRILLGRGHV